MATQLATPSIRRGGAPAALQPQVPEEGRAGLGAKVSTFDGANRGYQAGGAVVNRPPVAWALPAHGPLRDGAWGMKGLVVALRWAALALSLAAMGLRSPQLIDIAAAGVLTALAVARTFWPFEPKAAAQPAKLPAWMALGSGLGELVVCAAVVAATGLDGSPFVVSLAAACFICGLVVPVLPTASGAVAGVVALASAGIAGTLARPLASRYVELLAVLGALSMLGSYSEWLAQKNRESKDEEMERLRNLGEVNHLLLELHAKAVSLPAGLSLKVAVANLAGRLRQLLHPDVVVLMLSAPPGPDGKERWEVTLAEGIELPDMIEAEELFPALREAVSSLGPVSRCRLGPGEGVRLGARTGIYVPLWARDGVVGLLAVERVSVGQPFSDEELEMVEGVARHAGMAIDNARLFRRLRALGAEEERVRIARDLHDRVGQSLAYLALCLDRLHEEAGTSPAEESRRLSEELAGLAGEARKVVRELRTKLCDLRNEVTEQHGLTDALGGVLRRVEERSDIAATLSVSELAELSTEVAREVARVAEEAVNNAERHSGAAHLDVRVSWDGRAGELVVADDGRGLRARSSLRPDAFGILGMRERAGAIGGSLAISSAAGRGTTVTLRWGEAQ